MKFSRIVAMFIFATTLMGSMPAEAAGFFDWLTGLFEDGRPQTAQRADRGVRFEDRDEDQDQEEQDERNARRVPAPRPGRHGRRHNRREDRREERRNDRRQPAQQNRPVRNPRAQTFNSRESKKQALFRNLGLVGVGAIIAVLAVNTGLVDKIREVLGVARPARDLNNLATEFRETADAVRNIGRAFMDGLDERNNNRRPAQDN